MFIEIYIYMSYILQFSIGFFLRDFLIIKNKIKNVFKDLMIEVGCKIVDIGYFNFVKYSFREIYV